MLPEKNSRPPSGKTPLRDKPEKENMVICGSAFYRSLSKRRWKYVVLQAVAAAAACVWVCTNVFGRKVESSFEPGLSAAEKKQLLELVDAFNGSLTAHGIPFFMHSGTLLGSYRHHGLVPWDDDVDMMIPADRMDSVSIALHSLAPRFILNEKQVIRWKLYSPDGSPIKGSAFRFPFVDVSFYRRNATHLWDFDTNNYPDACFPIDNVLPLTTRPFEGRALPSPRNAKSALEAEFDLSQCVTASWNHRHETGCATRKADCSQFHALYPFVQRVPHGDGDCKELLSVNGKLISWLVRRNESC